MTKEQAETKLSLLPLTAAVTVYYEMISDAPYLAFEYGLPGGGAGTISIPINPTETNLGNLVDNLPLANADRLAALAIMLSPSLI
jgi:hypothetical protein